MMAKEPMNNRDLEVLRAKLLKQVKVMLKETEATKTRPRKPEEAKAKPKYSRKVIQRYREMEERRAFTRQIKKRVPVDLNTDEVILSCGHKLKTMAGLINAAAGKFPCRQC